MKNKIHQLLANTHGTTFAQIETLTPVALAAAHKKAGVEIFKHTTANVQLFNHIKDFRNVYQSAVKRSADKIAGNDAQAVADFESQGNYFEHTDCYSIVKHKDKDKFYLFCIYNNANSEYVMNNQIVNKATVAQYLTPAAAKALLAPSATVVNKTYDIEYSVVVRTIDMDNIIKVTANKQTVS